MNRKVRPTRVVTVSARLFAVYLDAASAYTERPVVALGQTTAKAPWQACVFDDDGVVVFAKTLANFQGIRK